MAVNPKALIPAKVAENAQTTQYTAVNVTTVIDQFTVMNTSAGAVQFSANVVTSGDVASSANRVIGPRSIAAGESYLCPEMINQVLESGSYISTLAGTASTLTIRASGREIT